MSENEHDDSPAEVDDPAGLRKRADKALKAAAEAEARAAEAERRALFAEAGIPSEGAGKYFRKGYEGELTIDAIKAEAEAAGLFKAAVAAEEEPGVPAEEIAALDAMRRSQTGGRSGAEPADWRTRMEGATSADEIAAIYEEYRQNR